MQIETLYLNKISYSFVEKTNVSRTINFKRPAVRQLSKRSESATTHGHARPTRIIILELQNLKRVPIGRFTARIPIHGSEIAA